MFGPRFRHFRDVQYGYEANGRRAREAEKRQAKACGRDGTGHAGLSPGLFAVFCPHGICHGFFLMSAGEGEVMVNDLFFHRLEGGAPMIICYDRACTLHTACLKREPWFFHNTLFRLDVLHSWNHQSCSEGYDPKVLRDRNLFGKSVVFNSQAAEQANAALRKISKSVTFMDPEEACIYTRGFLARRNKGIRERLASNAAASMP